MVLERLADRPDDLEGQQLLYSKMAEWFASREGRPHPIPPDFWRLRVSIAYCHLGEASRKGHSGAAKRYSREIAYSLKKLRESESVMLAEHFKKDDK